MASVFISYPQSQKAKVVTLADHLEARSLSYFWDDHLGVGLWEEALHTQLSAADAMIVIITQEVLTRGSGSYVTKEIQMALDLDYTKVLPILVGDFQLGDLDRLIGGFQILRVPSFNALFQNPHLPRLFYYLDDIKTYVAQGGRKANHTVTGPDLDQTVWPRDGDHLLERQSLALAIAMLEGDLPFFVVDAARHIQTQMEANFRVETEEEQQARPRGFIAPSQSELLSSIGAEQVTLRTSDGGTQEAVRFTDPNRRRALLSFIWNQQPDVRKFMLGWLQDLFEPDEAPELAQRISGGLGHLARIDLSSFRYELLSDWLSPTFQIAQLDAASHLLATAWSRPSNRPMIRDILVDLAKGKHIDPSDRSVAEEAALIVVMGTLGQWAPSVAIDILKILAPAFRRGPYWNEHMMYRLRTSSLIFAEKVSEEIEMDKEAKADIPDANDPEPDGASEDAEVTRIVGRDAAEAKGKSLPIAEFLEVLSRWIDTKVSSKMAKGQQQRMLLDRQVALFIFLTIFQRMPLYAASAPNHLTLEEIQNDIGQRQRSLLDAIKSAFVRGVVAEKRPGSEYLPRIHVQEVMRLFAIERHKSPYKMQLEEDPFLSLARDIATSANMKKDGYGIYVTRTCGRFLSEDEVDFVQSNKGI